MDAAWDEIKKKPVLQKSKLPNAIAIAVHQQDSARIIWTTSGLGKKAFFAKTQLGELGIKQHWTQTPSKKSSRAVKEGIAAAKTIHEVFTDNPFFDQLDSIENWSMNNCAESKMLSMIMASNEDPKDWYLRCYAFRDKTLKPFCGNCKQWVTKTFHEFTDPDWHDTRK